MPTLRGRVLLGWMPRDDAVRFLTTDCEFNPPIDEVAAGALWDAARARVDALPDRPCIKLPNLGFNASELGHQAKFFAFLKSIRAHDVIELRKVDLRELVARQYCIVTQRSDDYALRLQSPKAWLDEMVPTAVKPQQLRVQSTQTGMDTYSEFDVPHAEFYFGPHPQNIGTFTAQELLRHVTIMDGDDRTFLWAGYHRCFARVANAPPAAVPSAVVAVAKNVLVTPGPTIAAAGDPAIIGVDPLGVFGTKAPRFADFFAAGLFMDVDLRKKRYQLQVHAKLVALDDPT